nr:glycine betaine ABC transporter substrate-binding protein [Stratiformator vulcanicus]
MSCAIILAWFALPAMAQEAAEPAPKITIGSKTFTESVILGEIVAAVAREAGAEVIHQRQLGGTEVVWNALKSGGVDLYPDYTGTLRVDLFDDLNLETDSELRAELNKLGLSMSEPLGFQNTYAIGMLKGRAAELGIETISDLRDHPDLKFGFNHEFLQRSDGWPGLRDAYRLPQRDPIGLDHQLSYVALTSGKIDAVEVYSTDAKIAQLGLTVLEDDRNFFPDYSAVLVYRQDLAERAPEVLRNILTLEGAISEEQMRGMNSTAEPPEGRGEPESVIAVEFVNEKFGLSAVATTRSLAERIWLRTKQHLLLVGISAIMAILTAVPLGIVATKFPAVGRVILTVVGLLQTIPSLVLFVLAIPIFDIGMTPAIVALFLYSLLPIVRNTHSGLIGIPRGVRESAEVLGLPPLARMRLVELPLAAPSILAGIKTAIVINVGTATLGGFIGAGGYGEPIFAGLRKQDTWLMLEGAIPAAVMALAFQTLFDILERVIVSPGLRHASSSHSEN